MDYTSSELRKK